MKRMSVDEIKDYFNQRASSPLSNADILPELGLAILGLREAGIDVELTLYGESAEDVFKMRFDDYSIKEAWQQTAGVLRLGHAQYLVGIISDIRHADKEKQAGLWLKMSELDMRHQEGRDSIRHHIFDLKNDKDALIKLQKTIISTASMQARLNLPGLGPVTQAPPQASIKKLTPDTRSTAAG